MSLSLSFLYVRQLVASHSAKTQKPIIPPVNVRLFPRFVFNIKHWQW